MRIRDPRMEAAPPVCFDFIPFSYDRSAWDRFFLRYVQREKEDPATEGNWGYMNHHFFESIGSSFVFANTAIVPLLF